MDVLRALAPARSSLATRPRSAAPEQALDQVDLSGPQLPRSEGVEPGVRGGQLGALGPVIEPELARLNLPFAERKRFRLWGSPTRPLTPAQAAERLERGQASRLLVETGGKQLPLTSKTELAALEHLQGQSERPAPARAATLKRLTDAGYSFESGSAYETYLAAQQGQPILVLHHQAPAARVEPAELEQDSLADRVGSSARQWDALWARMEKDPAGATAAAVRHLGALFPDRPDRLVGSLPASPLRAVASRMLAQLTPEEVALRLELLAPPLAGSDVLQRAEALEKMGWRSELAGLQEADRALRHQTAEVGFPEAARRLERLAARQQPELVAEFARMTPDLSRLEASLEKRLSGCEPGKALRSRKSAHQAYLELDALADDLVAAKHTWSVHSRGVMRAYARGPLDSEQLALLHEMITHQVAGEETDPLLTMVSEPLAGLSFAERAAAFRELCLQTHSVMAQQSVRQEVYRAWQAEVRQGGTPAEAGRRVREVGDRLLAQKQTWSSNVGPIFRAQATLAAGSDDQRSFLLELCGHGVVGEQAPTCLGLVAQDCGKTTLAERQQAFRTLCLGEKSPLADHSCCDETMRSWRAEIEGGASAEEATRRLKALGAMLSEHNITWGSYTAEALRCHQAYLAGSSAYQARSQFLKDLLTQGVRGDDVTSVMEQVVPDLPGTTLAERIETFRAFETHKPLAQNPCRALAVAAWRADVQSGSAPERARSRVEQLAGTLEKAGVSWSGYVGGVLECSRDHLAGGDEKDAGRALLARLLTGGVAAEEAPGVLATLLEPSDCSLSEKVQEFEKLCLVKDRPLARNGVREATAEALQAQLECGIPVEEAGRRLDELAQAATRAQVSWAGHLSLMLTSCSDSLSSPSAVRVGYAMLSAELDRKTPADKLNELAARVEETLDRLQAAGLTPEQSESLLQGATLDTLDQVVEAATQAASLRRGATTAAAVGEDEGHVVFQGVRLTKRGERPEQQGPEMLQEVAVGTVAAAGDVKVEPVCLRPADDVELARQAARLGARLDQNNTTSSRAVCSALLAIAGDEEKARQAYSLAGRFDRNNSRSSRAAYAVAAAIAGDPERARAAYRLGSEFDANNSHATRSLFTVAAALAGERKKAREAHRIGRALDNHNSTRTRACFTLAAAIAGNEAATMQAAALGSAFDRNNSTRSRSIFTIAAAIAGDAAKAEQAHELATEFDRGNSTASRALFTMACAVAGTEERARLAHQLATEFDRNSSTKSRALFTLAAAAALNPERAHLVPPINYDYLYDDD